MIQIISFDIGGTLVDTSRKNHLKEVLSDYLRQKGLYSADAVNCLKLHDFSIPEYCQYVGIDDVAKVQNIIEQHNQKHILYSDVLQTIRYLKQRYKLVTISNAMSLKRNTLSIYEIEEYFDLELYSFQFGSLKPDTKMFLYVEQYFNVNAKYCLHVGDNRNDICGANRAGWISVLLNRKNTYKEEEFQGINKPDYIISNMSELLEIVQTTSV